MDKRIDQKIDSLRPLNSCSHFSWSEPKDENCATTRLQNNTVDTKRDRVIPTIVARIATSSIANQTIEGDRNPSCRYAYDTPDYKECEKTKYERT